MSTAALTDREQRLNRRIRSVLQQNSKLSRQNTALRIEIKKLKAYKETAERELQLLRKAVQVGR